jgi:WD40 repeat protein
MSNKLQKSVTLIGWGILLLASIACVPLPPRKPSTESHPSAIVESSPPLSVPDRTFRGEHTDVRAVVIDATGHWMATADVNGQITMWDFAQGTAVWTAKPQRADILSLAFRGDGKILVASGGWNGVITFWDVSTGQKIKTISTHQHAVHHVAFSPDDKTLASAGSDRSTNRGRPYGSVKLWDPDTGKELRSMSVGLTSINALAFSPDGKILATGGDDKIVRLWNPETGKLQNTLSGYTEGVMTLAFRPDGLQLASGGGWGFGYHAVAGYKLWDLKTMSALSEPSSNYAVSALAYRPDGRVLAIAGMDETSRPFASVDFFSFDENRVVRHFIAHRGWISAIVFTPDGKWLVSVGTDGGIRCWH